MAERPIRFRNRNRHQVEGRRARSTPGARSVRRRRGGGSGAAGPRTARKPPGDLADRRGRRLEQALGVEGRAGKGQPLVAGAVPVSSWNRRSKLLLIRARRASGDRQGLVEVVERPAHHAADRSSPRVGPGPSTYWAWPPGRCGGRPCGGPRQLATGAPSDSPPRDVKAQVHAAAPPRRVRDVAVVDVEDRRGRARTFGYSAASTPVGASAWWPGAGQAARRPPGRRHRCTGGRAPRRRARRVGRRAPARGTSPRSRRTGRSPGRPRARRRGRRGSRRLRPHAAEHPLGSPETKVDLESPATSPVLHRHVEHAEGERT